MKLTTRSLMLALATLAGCAPATGRDGAPLSAVPLDDVCGDGVRTGAEQCDDGNTVNLDGCDSSCNFEQDQRVNSLTLQFATDADCSPNALGGAIASIAQGSLQTSLSKGVSDGSISILMQALGLADSSGSDGPLQLGIMNGAPVAGTGYNGNSDLDWWYTTDPTSIDANRRPLHVLAGNLSAHKLTASGASVTLGITLAGARAALTMNQVRLSGFTGAPPTAPTIATAGTTPGHLPSESLDPALTSFATTGGSAGTDKLCGNITAESLSHVPAPAALIQGGASPCTQGYTVSSSLVDVLVGGCTITVVIFPITAITPTQPDTPGGDRFTLALDGNHHVASCTDNGAAVDLATCLASATYSSYFQFATDRVIAK
jgi:cysteine-rich repeat protein